MEFSTGCRNMGFLGNVKKSFSELDSTGSGIITFDEVDSGWFNKILKFSNCLLSKYSSYESAWRALDDNANNMIEEDEFALVCPQIGYKGNSKALFNQLKQNKLAKYLTLEDIICTGASILSGVKTAEGQPQILVACRSDADLLSTEEKAKKAIKDMNDKKQGEKDLQKGANDTASLKALLIRKYGSITAAWRYGLDLSSTGHCSFHDFSKACRDIGFNGNIKAAFNELNTGQKGILTFDQLDAEWCTRLKSFSEKLQEKFGSFGDVMGAFDQNRNNMIEVDEVAAVCKLIGCAEDPRALYMQLRRDPARRFITEEDLNAKGIITWAAK